MKKQSDLSRLMGYAGNYRYFTYASWVLSAVSALVALVPFVYIWKILRDVLNAAPDYAQAVNIPRYGWMEVSQINPEKLMILYSIVFQDVTLFDNTILENIRLGRKGATDKEVLAAAKLANCEEFAEKLPDKWNTTIGENGCALSGGERQRISIARAFLKDAPIILLDEATASLDVENETAIQEVLSHLIKDKTVLIIAHRMRTVSSADKIVVLKDGTVAEQGSPAQLLHDGGIFDHMVQLQTKSQGWSLTKA